ncbi:MAG: SulP family inorganic anion transporter [Actinobacteria bacterium]|nr:SulP family inorganic anion transporter [Actinomycetota bacterium]
MNTSQVVALLRERILPERSDYAGLSRSWRADLIAGITVGVVALPLALAFGVTSGVGAAAGLITAIVAGLVAAVFGGSNLQVSGPTGAMAVVLVPIVARYGAEAVIPVAIMAGGMVMAMGVLGLGRLVDFIPWPVVEGFTIGIATIIFLQQIPLALDVPKPEGESTALVAFRAVQAADWSSAVQSLALVGLVVVLMVLLPRVRRSFPASIVAVVVATLLVTWLGWDVMTIGPIPAGLPAPSIPVLDTATTSALFSAALAVAALAAIESLLSARVADGMSDTSRLNPDRELFGQGLANVASGIFGGMPATGAIARTAVNVRAGARTRVSAIVHSVLILLIVLFLGGLVAVIPLAALAGVLMVTAVRMVDRRSAQSILRSTKSDALVMILTALATVIFDLILAVEIGIAVAAVLALLALAKSSTVEPEQDQVLDRAHDQVTDDDERQLMKEHIAVYRLDGALFFGAAQHFLDELTSVADVRVVILRLGGISVIDASGGHALEEIISGLKSRGIAVLLCGVAERPLRIRRAVGAVDALDAEQHVFMTLPAAIEHAHGHVRRHLSPGD